MKTRSPVSAIAAGSIIAAALSTAIVGHGWWIWPPVLLAIFVCSMLKAKLKL